MIAGLQSKSADFISPHFEEVFFLSQLKNKQIYSNFSKTQIMFTMSIHLQKYRSLGTCTNLVILCMKSELNTINTISSSIKLLQNLQISAVATQH